MSIVRTAYRYRHPPGKRKPVAIDVPAIVRAGEPRHPGDWKQRISEPRSKDQTKLAEPPVTADRKSAVVTARRPTTELRDNDDAQSAIVTIRHKPERILPPGLLPDTEEEANRRADAADAMFRELVRRVREGR